MAEEGLDAAEVGAIIEEVGGEAVAEFVRGEVRGKPGLNQAGADHMPDCSRGQAGAGFVDEERPAVDAGALAVFGDRLKRGTSNRADPFLRALSGDAGSFADDIDIRNIESTQLGESHSCGIKQLDDRRVPRGHPRGSLFGFFLSSGRLNQRFDLFGGHEPRKLLFRFRQQDFVQDIFSDEIPTKQKCMKRPQGRETQPHA